MEDAEAAALEEAARALAMVTSGEAIAAEREEEEEAAVVTLPTGTTAVAPLPSAVSTELEVPPDVVDRKTSSATSENEDGFGEDELSPVTPAITIVQPRYSDASKVPKEFQEDFRGPQEERGDEVARQLQAASQKLFKEQSDLMDVLLEAVWYVKDELKIVTDSYSKQEARLREQDALLGAQAVRLEALEAARAAPAAPMAAPAAVAMEPLVAVTAKEPQAEVKEVKPVKEKPEELRSELFSDLLGFDPVPTKPKVEETRSQPCAATAIASTPEPSEDEEDDPLSGPNDPWLDSGAAARRVIVTAQPKVPNKTVAPLKEPERAATAKPKPMPASLNSSRAKAAAKPSGPSASLVAKLAGAAERKKEMSVAAIAAKAQNFMEDLGEKPSAGNSGSPPSKAAPEVKLPNSPTVPTAAKSEPSKPIPKAPPEGLKQKLKSSE
ncbi:unnamed protein product [Effrenium voratum]|nr:unnamed protein product [Effrenium voratum]